MIGDVLRRLNVDDDGAGVVPEAEKVNGVNAKMRKWRVVEFLELGKNLSWVLNQAG